MDPTTAALEKEHEAVSVVDKRGGGPSMTGLSHVVNFTGLLQIVNKLQVEIVNFIKLQQVC